MDLLIWEQRQRSMRIKTTFPSYLWVNNFDKAIFKSTYEILAQKVFERDFSCDGIFDPFRFQFRCTKISVFHVFINRSLHFRWELVEIGDHWWSISTNSHRKFSDRLMNKWQTEILVHRNWNFSVFWMDRNLQFVRVLKFWCLEYAIT